MAIRREFPLTRRITASIQSIVYPSPEGGRGVTVKGTMQLTLVFEPTEQHDIVRVRIEDIQMKFPPIRIPFDIDNDGQLECLDFNDLVLGAKAFDLEMSGGEYNLQDGRIAFSIIILVPPQALAQEGKEFGTTPIRFELKERGLLDLETGYFKTYSGIWSVPDGRFAGLTISNTATGYVTVTPECNVRFGVYLANSFSLPDVKSVAANSEEKMPDTVWMCQGPISYWHGLRLMQIKS